MSLSLSEALGPYLNTLMTSEVRPVSLGAIQVLRNAVGGGQVSAFPEKSVKLGFHRYGCAMRHPAKNGYSVNA